MVDVAFTVKLMCEWRAWNTSLENDGQFAVMGQLHPAILANSFSSQAFKPKAFLFTHRTPTMASGEAESGPTTTPRIVKSGSVATLVSGRGIVARDTESYQSGAATIAQHVELESFWSLISLTLPSGDIHIFAVWSSPSTARSL